MAYPTVSNPYGFKPINRVDGMPYAGAIRQIPIASGYTTAIYNGDPVKIVVGGTIERTAASGAVTTGSPVGVLVGCQYTNSSGQTVQAQYFPGSGVTNAVAYVVDDPLAMFKVAVAYANGVVTTVAQNAVGTNMSYNLGTGSSTTGDSGAFVTAASGANTAALPFRVIAVVPETATSATTFTEVYVKVNLHQYNNTTGLDLA
jgi:hypothetical protein